MRNRDPQKIAIIKEKALEIIVKEGFDGLSMHKLAKAAKVSPATIYIYFKDRDDLIIAIGIEKETEMFQKMMNAFDPEMNFAEGLKHQWKNKSDFFLKHPQVMQFTEQIRYSKYHEKIHAEIKAKFFGQLWHFLKKAIENKELRPLPMEVYWSLAFAPLYQLLKFNIHQKGLQNERFELTDDILNLTLNIVLKGLKPDS